MTTNRRILVDNATLSGVERIIGTSKIKNLNNIDNDILCLEKLITAILFSDKLIAIDDYKSEYRSSRLKNFDFISFLTIEKPTYDKLAGDAAEFAKSMVFSLDGSKPAGDVVSFFESLRIDPQMRWDIFVSSEYLTLSLLVQTLSNIRYESSIDSAFRNEEADAEMVSTNTDFAPGFSVARHSEIRDIKDLIHAISSNSSNYRGFSSNSMLHRLIFGYGWTAERSYFYNSIAAMNDADAFLSPLRDAFCESCCRISSRSQVNSLLDRLKADSQRMLVRILEPSGNAQFAMRLPFFTAYFISKADNPNQCIELALSERNSSEFRDCRVIFHNLAQLSAKDRYKEINGILQYLDQSCERLMRKYAVSTENGLQFSMSLGFSGVSATLGTKLNDLFRAYKNRPFSRVFRNIAQDMLNVERLGGLYEKICSSVREHSEAGRPKIAITPKFMENKSNEHGGPAEV